MLKNRADSLTLLSLMAWLVSSACDFYLFPVILGRPRWPISPISKMALVGLSLLTVEVKSSDPRDSANDQKSLPRADLLRQIPRLCSPPPPPPPQRLNNDRCIIGKGHCLSFNDRYQSCSPYHCLYNELCKTRVLIGL